MCGATDGAWKVRQETPMTLKWIAERLHMGTWKTLNERLHELRKNQKARRKWPM
jgi:hypothetical protein